MGARVYLPTIGRFLQVDPVQGGTPNAYTYTPDPINSNDYTGLFSFKQFVKSVVSTVVKAVKNTASKVVSVVTKTLAVTASVTKPAVVQYPNRSLWRGP